MSDKCECQDKFLNTYPDLKDDIYPKEFYTTIDFGCIIFGTKPHQILRLKNTATETKEFSIRRDPNTNPIYYAFDFNISRAKIASGENLEVKICFCPKVPREMYIDHLEILDDSTQFWICLKGNSEGPLLSASTRLLQLYYKPHKYLNKLTFELKNISKIATQFQFDVNEDEEFFRLSKINGRIEPNCYENITVHFIAKEHGCYCRQLVCLNLYNEPIMIELRGFHTDNPDFTLDDTNIISFPLQNNELRGYSGYLNDSVKILGQLPPFSFNAVYVDFGRILPKCEKFSKVISFTNHLEGEAEIFWENFDNVFRINPKQVKVQSTESVMFDVNFDPNEPDTLYSRIITAKIFWMDTRQTGFDDSELGIVKVPLTASVRILGHSFPENKTWIPQVQIIPEAIIFPVTVPNTISYTTFLLKSFGHLPVSFKFLPPKTTNFILKPMIGIMKDFQIILAQLQTDLSNKKAYVECWGVELNGNRENCIPFYMKGFSEYPSLQIGSSNVVKFNTIQYGCQERLNVCIKNNSGHFIEYNFILKENSYIIIDHPQGFLATNEIVYLYWYFSASPEAPPKSQIRCEIRPVYQMKSISGTPIDIFTTIYADFSYSELCATPSTWESPQLLYGTTTTTRFHMFNFGESPVHYLLVVDDDHLGNIILTPTQGTLKNKEKIEIMVVVNGKELGSHKLNVYYTMRTHDDTMQLVNDQKYKIFTIIFECVLPTIQIMEIGYYNFGPLFSKLTLWEMFNVDAINEVLLDIKPGETKQLKINTPGNEVNDEILTANLFLYNTSNFETDLVLKRKQLCQCKLVEVSQGISFRSNIYDCPHRYLFNLELADQHFYPHARNKLTITLNYTFQGLHTLGYIFQLCHNRTLELFVNMDVLSVPTETASIYRPDYTLRFKSTFIGEKEPLLEGFYIYNNTSTDVWYSIDLEMLQMLRMQNDFEIFTCLNPEGNLAPFSSTALLFKFIPIEAKKYQVELPIKIGEKMYELVLYGEGTMTVNLEKLTCTALTNKRNLFFEDDEMVSFSTEHITAVLPVWSKTQKLLFIKNITKDKIIGYSFQSSCVEGAVEANVLFPKGSLNPKESHGIIVEIVSFDKPSILRLQLACKLLDHTQYVEHRKSEVAYYMQEIKQRDYFTITEDGISYPTNDLVVLPKPEVFYQTLAITTIIVGIGDRDLYFTATDQLQHSPQYTIRLNPLNILNTISPAHDTLDDPILTSYTLKNIKEKQSHIEEIKTKYDYGDFLQYYKGILNYCIADVVFSDMFHKISEMIIKTKSPYYVQFTTDTETQYENPLSYVNSRKKLLADFLEQPEAPIVADVFQELIADCVHEIFQLGSQVKHRKRETFMYNVSLAENKKCSHL